ncbi:MAG: hypothetical protein MAG715_00849 [Methanonatronarchaeales archaeon]|nr:hypothetical protein [Methanonatronarchaeales archaeon]
MSTPASSEERPELRVDAEGFDEEEVIAYLLDLD